MPSFVNGVRSEFTVSDIEYSRDGGWFLSYRKAALLTILVMCLCLFSAYMGRQSSDQIVYVHVPSESSLGIFEDLNTANANEMDFAETLNGVLDKPMVWASNSTRKNLTHVMRNWVSNEGFPVLHVTRDEKKRDHLKFRQEWFHYEIPKGVSSDDYERQWYIPVTLTTLTNTDFNDTEN
ncbi:uncharacterized protein LOC103519458 [Diaphorina citri]|uniref:Uncharacterized protein LOC103519458 n=1 Tax=Diaphorina citri TaxID=121845 RepID=A0A1S3DJ93_DIACI|nr:uncharacterized protein LOC103519458 [Diaphorina citri]